MSRWLGRSSTAVRAASRGAPTLSTAPMAVVVVGAPPPGDGLAREALAQQLDGGGAAWQWRQGFGVSRGSCCGVYIGVSLACGI
jgi:hypothetical protein